MTQGRAQIPKVYDHRKVEARWYFWWERKGYFIPQIDPAKTPFVIIMPPPNVTGELHLGTAYTAVLEDAMARWHRMRGEPTLWLPGTDHAGIAGQNVVEQLLATEGLTRHDLGRERFLERMWEWMDRYRPIIAEQHRRLGASCDWSRERFTMDPEPSLAVRTTFVNLYRKGLIYRGERIINWCPRCQTALSDLEVDHQEIRAHLYYVRYPLADTEVGGGRESEKGFITVATTRPETILGDTAVAVNPDDQRYRDLVGQEVILPRVGRPVPVITDSQVDPAFGTGAVKITPAHDPLDFEIGQRHGLESINILSPDATMNENAGPYQGQDRFQCRETILKDLEKEGLLVKTETHVHSVGHCQRCHTIVEPLVSRQWFVKTAPLARPAIDAVREGRIEIVPQRFTRVYLNWLENIRDWCISRQLWWGHRIPVWYCGECPGVTVSVENPSSCGACGSEDIVQDPDVLDTWFSSALWPHSTLGWPQETADLAYFYPTTVMETGYDILFFWVARMVMMGRENTGEVPFRKVYLHGLIRDEKGEKMSKSRGNVVDPQQVMESYGTDALRFALTTGSSPGNDMKLGAPKLEGSRNFANKLWNAARFVLSNLDGPVGTPQARTAQDRWILSRLNRVTAEVNRLQGEFQLGEALHRLHDFLWGEYCDWYLEMAKLRLRQGDRRPLSVLVYVLETSLRLLHPFMPFITEELWQGLKPHLPGEQSASIMVAPYPIADEQALDPEAEEELGVVVEVVRSIRNARAEDKIEPGRYIEAIVVAGGLKPALESHAPTIEALGRARPLAIWGPGEERARPEKARALVLGRVEVLLPFQEVARDRERQRLEKERGVSQEQVRRLGLRLEDRSFLTRAPATVVEKERQKLERHQDRLRRLEEELSQLGR